MSGRKIKGIAVALACCAVLLAIYGGFLWWWNQPQQVFPYWSEEPVAESGRNGCDIVDFSLVRHGDSTGDISFTVINRTEETKTFEMDVWLAYWHQGVFHCVLPDAVPTDGPVTLAPGDSTGELFFFPADTFGKPGLYRLCVQDVECVDIGMLTDGTAVSGVATLGSTAGN